MGLLVGSPTACKGLCNTDDSTGTAADGSTKDIVSQLIRLRSRDIDDDSKTLMDEGAGRRRVKRKSEDERFEGMTIFLVQQHWSPRHREHFSA